MNRFAKKALLPLAVVAVNSGMVVSAEAVEERSALALEEVVVTARKREESLVDVPMSIVAISGEEIAKMNVGDVSDLQNALPNFNIVSLGGATSTPFVYIRGQGTSNAVGVEQSVGWFVDGVYGSRGEQFRAPTFDLASIEVLRGPQGTVLGKNIIAGAVNMRTARPTDEFEGHVSAAYTDENGSGRVDGVVSGALSDTVRARLALMYREDDGWGENISDLSSNSGEPMQQLESENARLSLEWDISDNLSSFFKFETSSLDTENTSVMTSIDTSPALSDMIVDDDFISTTACDFTASLVPGGSYQGLCDQTGRRPGSYNYLDVESYLAEFSYDWSDYSIVATSAWSRFESEFVSDNVAISLPVFDLAQTQDFEQFSQEIRVESPGGQLFDWTAGLYYLDSTYNSLYSNLVVNLDALGLPVPDSTWQRDLDLESETQSAFAEGTINVTDNFRLIVGWRWTHEEKAADKVVTAYNEDGEAVTADTPEGLAILGFYDARLGGDFLEPDPGTAEARVIDNRVFTFGERKEVEHTFAGTLQYDVGDTQYYLTIAEGFKAGGFIENNIGIDPGQFEPESATSYELGAKFVLADGAANVNLAAFYVEYEDLQVQTFNGGGYEIGNAPKSITQGFEFDGRWRMTEALTLSFSGAYLEAAYDEYIGPCNSVESAGFDPDNPTGNFVALIDSRGLPICGKDYSDLDNRQAAEWNGSVTLAYEQPIGDSLIVTASATANYRDDVFTQTDLDPRSKSPSYTTYDARLGLGSVDGAWNLAVIGRNLDDERYLVYGYNQPFFGGYNQLINNPRFVTVQASYRF